MRLAISGPPGSGKTTVAKAVAKDMRCKLILTGQVFRRQAKAAGLDVLAYNKLAETDRSIDERLDEEIIKLASASDKVVVEGRLSGWLLGRRNVASFKVCITAPKNVRAARIAKREGTSVSSELAALKKREISEKKRYLEFYGIDIDDMSVYDLVIDSSDISAKKAADIVIGAVRKSIK